MSKYTDGISQWETDGGRTPSIASDYFLFSSSSRCQIDSGNISQFDSEFNLSGNYDARRKLILERMGEAERRFSQLTKLVDKGRWCNTSDLSRIELFYIGAQSVRILSSIEAIERATRHVGIDPKCRS